MSAAPARRRLRSVPALSDRRAASEATMSTPAAIDLPFRAPRLPIALLCALLLALAGCSSLPAAVLRQPSTAHPAAAAPSPLQHLAEAETAAAAGRPGESALRLLPNGDHALDARLALVQRAEQTIDAQYYVLADDDSGVQFLRALRDAARRGVRVRLLVDDFHAGAVQPLLAGLAAYAHAEVRLYNPLPARHGSPLKRLIGSLHELERINHRMHNKLLIADNAFAIAGGRNIGDEYFMRSAAANFIDLDVLVAGPAVDDLAAVFDRYWNSERAWPVASLAEQDGSAARAAFERRAVEADADVAVTPHDVLGRPPVSAGLAAGGLGLQPAAVRVIADDPDRTLCEPTQARCTPGALDQVLASLREARNEVVITSPYFVPGERGLAMLQQARSAGVRVKVLTNSLGATDEPLVHTGYARYRGAMLGLGVEIRELSPTLAARTGWLGTFGRSAARLHAKVVVADGRRVTLGSMNMDRRSARLNTELALQIDSPALAAELARLGSRAALAGSYRVRLNPAGQLEWLVQDGDREAALADEPDADWALKFRLGLMSLLVSEAML